MEPTSKPSSVRKLLVRVLLLGVFVLLLRFVYVVAVHGGACDSGDFCLFSSPSYLAADGAAAGSGGGGPFVRVVGGGRGGAAASTPALRALWTSREWRKAVEYYSIVFQDLLAEGFLSPASRSLCVDAPAGYEVLALREIGVPDAVGVAKKKAPPLVVASDLLRQPFAAGEFDFVFAGRSLDRSKRPADLAAEIARTTKPEGFLAVHTASAADLYSLRSLWDLFPGFKSKQVGSSSILSPEEDDLENSDRPSGRNSVNKCSIPEHKLQIVQLAEPLIEEEPLKPWITLKRNLKNIKYLPSVADIGFKQRYVYVDVGARSYGSSIGSWFKKQYPKQNHTFEIYAIEADKAFHKEYASKKGVNLLPFAAWVRNETLTFEINQNPDLKDDEKGHGMGRIRPVGGSNPVSSGEVRAIQGFDFAQWLKRTVSKNDYVVMKMDVEGTEFDLVPRLFETGAICLIDELFLECHYNRWQKCCPGRDRPNTIIHMGSVLSCSLLSGRVVCLSINGGDHCGN
uniref:Methyltransferase FkbM domain-containing protein n=1 Tax=Ananas comosus var. bracteatus TaxID=296719 RepID=A0A6V7PDM7_ANACO|nr:unnamed protein product [Ananas comosus var. bracteatus]